MDPAEWAAKLEDRLYNNHSFKVFFMLFFFVPLHCSNVPYISIKNV